MFSDRMPAFLFLYAFMTAPLGAAPPDEVRAFHQRLIAQEPDWFEGGGEVVRAYYTVLEGAPLSTPAGSNEGDWDVPNVHLSGKSMARQPDGSYMMRSVSLRPTGLPPLASLSTATSYTTPVTRGTSTHPISFSPTQILREPVLPQDFDGFAKFAQDPHRYFVLKVHWRGILPPEDSGDAEGEDAGEITFTSLHCKRFPMRARTMAVTYRKDTQKTRLFFDFSDAGDQFTQIYSKEFPHARRGPSDPPKTVYRVVDHRLRAFDPKQVTYNIFDCDSTWSAWRPRDMGAIRVVEPSHSSWSWSSFFSFWQNFYGPNGENAGHLGHFYTIPADGGRLEEGDSIVWVFADNGPSDVFYKRTGEEEALENRHVYSDGHGGFSLTRRLRAVFKPYLDASSPQTFEYLRLVPKLPLKLLSGRLMQGGPQTWPQGVYGKTVQGTWEKWLQEGPGGKEVVIDHNSGNVTSATFQPTFSPSSADESVLQCDATQRASFWGDGCFAQIYAYNVRLVEGLGVWTKITDLNLSSLKDGRSGGNASMWESDWDRVLPALGKMTQLTVLNFSNNSVLVQGFDGDYDDLANRARRYHVQLGGCLSRLTRLKELHIEGLWIRPKEYLGPVDAKAKITGIVNHDDQRGVRAIVDALCQLPELETLSMDGIPEVGYGIVRRNKKTAIATLVTPFVQLGAIATMLIDEHAEEDSLKTLCRSMAYRLGQRQALKKISVYAPFEKFGEYFCGRLKAHKPSLVVNGPWNFDF